MSAIQSAPGPVSDLTWDEIYQELKRLAHRNLYASRPGHTLSTTALVNEVYIKLVKSQELNLADRQHLMALSCKAMRQVLVDYARRKAAQKRQTDIVVDAPPRLAQSDLLAVEEALNALATGLNLTVRNVTTHTRTELSEQEAMERLAAYSYLARLLDQCETASADAEESDR